MVPDPGDWVPRVPPEIVPLAPAPDRVPPGETLTSVDWPVVPERCTDVPDSSRIVVRRLAGTDLSSSTVVERAALPRLRFVATLPDDFERFTVRRSPAGSSETVVERRVVTLGCSEVSVRVRTDVPPLSRDSTPTEAPPRPPGWTEPPVVVEVFGA